MFNPEIKYAFNQFETALIAFVSNIQLKLQNLVPNLPVFIMNTGDFSYMVNKKFVEIKNEEVYLKTPRFVIKIDDIQPNTAEDTNQYNKVNYLFDSGNEEGPKPYQCVARRRAYNVQISCNFISPNFITMLNHTEVTAILMSRDNVFTYEFLGNTFQSAYVIQSSGNELPSIDMGQGGTRNVTNMLQIELQIHLLVPRIESIILQSETGFDEIDFGVVSKKDESAGIEKDESFKPYILEDIREEIEAPMMVVKDGKLIPKGIKFS